MVFLRKDANKKKKLAKVWRKPKGMHNKRRLKHAGHAKIVSPGYKKPASLVNSYNGKSIKNVERFEDLASLNKDTDAAQIKKISKKNKVKILKECKSKGITVVNLNVDKYLKDYDVSEDKVKSVKNKKTESKDNKSASDDSSKEEKTKDNKSDKK